MPKPAPATEEEGKLSSKAKGGKRRWPVGAEIMPAGGVHFRVWAPARSKLEVVLEGGPGAPDVIPLEKDRDGFHEGHAPGAGPGSLYRLRIDGDAALLPDPASRFQPEGPHGPSEVIDPSAYHWKHDDWKGVEGIRHVIYELHVGTFTPEGNWAAAAAQLEELGRLGITLIEVMPVADFPGDFGWGYDGVDLWATTRLYGRPDDFRRFVDRAHAAGIGVILDVVYNHLGPDGNYLPRFSQDYFTDRYETEWGEPINFDGPGSGPVRDFFVSNAAYWIEEFRLDGLRLDATQSIFDAGVGRDHILAEIVRAAREAARDRSIYIVAENEPQDGRLASPAREGGYDMDALWNDDFHHSAMVALTGRNEAYYNDYLGSAQELLSSCKWGFLYQGQHYFWQKNRRGSPALQLPSAAFVHFIQNHDQVANSLRGERVDGLTSGGRLRAMTALTLLGPATPMLFMGQEFAASAPFLYFADHEPSLSRKVFDGRREFIAQFPSIALPEVLATLPDPADPDTFRRCKLDFGERESHAPIYRLHRDLIALRQTDHAWDLDRRRSVDGAVLGPQAFLLRYLDREGDDRLLLINLGRALTLSPAPEPLLAPPSGTRWGVAWSSEDLKYGGSGAPAPEGEDGRWSICGEAAFLLVPDRLVPAAVPAGRES